MGRARLLHQANGCRANDCRANGCNANGSKATGFRWMARAEPGPSTVDTMIPASEQKSGLGPWPRGLPFIVVNEGCERFSYYGMKSILKVYLAAWYLEQGSTQAFAQTRSTVAVHLFMMAVYATPLVGAVIADRYLGKYRTILWLSLVYCLGHGVLALCDSSLVGVYSGLALIAVGAGGIKPCVSAHLGDQFDASNWGRLEQAFQIFYFIINLGAFFSTLLIPWVKERFGWSVAFAIPGVLTACATGVFWLGRRRFVHVPPSPGGRLGLFDALTAGFAFVAGVALVVPVGPGPLVRIAAGFLAGLAAWYIYRHRQRIQPQKGFLALSGALLKARLWLGLSRIAALRIVLQRFPRNDVEGALAIYRIAVVFLLVSCFWALWDQYATSWLDQAQMMHAQVSLGSLGSLSILPEQIQAANPILVMLLLPVMSRFVYPRLQRFSRLSSPLGRMTAGMWVAAASFLLVAALQWRLDTGGRVHLLWQLGPYLLLTVSEILVSITGLEFAYSQAPHRVKSLVMSFWLLTTAAGNLLTAWLAEWLTLPLREFFLVFTLLMSAAAFVFGIVARRYRYRDYPQPSLTSAH